MVASGFVAWASAHALTETLVAHEHATRRVDHVVGPVLLTGAAALATSFVALAVLALYGPDLGRTTRRTTWVSSLRWGAAAPASFVAVDLVEHLMLGQAALSAVIVAIGVIIHAVVGTAVAGAVQACTRALRIALRIPDAFVARPRVGVSRSTRSQRCAQRHGCVSLQHGRGPPTGFAPVLVHPLADSTA